MVEVELILARVCVCERERERERDGAFLRANASKNTLIMRKTVKKDIAKIDEDLSLIHISEPTRPP